MLQFSKQPVIGGHRETRNETIYIAQGGITMKNIIIETERFIETEIKIELLIRRWAPIYISVNLSETICGNKALLMAEFRQVTNKTYGDTRYIIGFYNSLQEDVMHQIMWVDHLLGYAYTTENLVNSLIKAGFTKEKVVDYVLNDIDNLKAFDIESAFIIAKKNLK